MEISMNISYDHYRIFYNVAKYKSFTRAAEVMYANQPNLTRAIKSLEGQLGCTLFERTNKGVRLTEDGRELYEHISVAFEHIEAGEESLSAKHSMENGMVSIGVTEIALRCFLLPILKCYHELYPGVRIRILNVSTPQALKMTDNRLIDLAVVTTPIESNSRLQVTDLCELREAAVCHRDFDAPDTLSVHDLSHYPIISLGAGSATYDFYIEEFLKYGISFAPDIEAATADQIIPLVRYGLGIGFVPIQFVEGEADIRIISLREDISPRQITLIRKKEHSLPLPARELLDLIKRY